MGPLSAHLRTVRGALGSAVENAQRSWGRRAGLLLRLEDQAGNCGYGEASPLPGYSLDSLDSASDTLRRWLRQSLPPRDAHPSLESWLRAALAPIGEGRPAARFAAETALLDLLGQRLGRPIHRLLAEGLEWSTDKAGECPAGPVSRPLAALLPALHDPQCRSVARRAVAEGYSTLKIKIGAAGQLPGELDSLRRLRTAMGSEVLLRLDANGALPVADLDRSLEALATLDPELLEEPVQRGDWPALKASPLPLAIDESLQGLVWPRQLQPLVQPLLRQGTLRALVLKPMALGGALRCLRLARWGEGWGVATFVTHLFDGPVALAAASHLALALPGEVLACGLAPHAGLSIWPALSQPMQGGGRIVSDGRPGLGLDLSPETW